MKKRVLAVVLVFLFGMLFSSCSPQGEEIKEKYVKTENGYALEQFTGATSQMSFTVRDEYEGEAVTGLLKFSIANAEYLEELVIGKNISYIDPWALANCNKLRSITVHPDNETYASVDGVLFSKDMKTLLVYPNYSHGAAFDRSGQYSAFASYSVPDSVEIINEKAFYKCYGLGEIRLPSHLKEIGARAFTRCENLKSIRFPDTLERLGEDSFSFCKSLTRVYIPACVTAIDDYAFFGANGVEKFEMERPSDSGMQLSEKWLPEKQSKGSLINEKTPVEWNVGRKGQ